MVSQAQRLLAFHERICKTIKTGELACFYARRAVLVLLHGGLALGVDCQSKGSTAMGSAGLGACEQYRSASAHFGILAAGRPRFS
jgi:hypothetical protein